MVSVEFIFNNNLIVVPCDINEKMKDICQRFISKAEITNNSSYYLYQGNQINLELKYGEIIGAEDRNKNSMKILANLVEEEDQTEINALHKLKYIICPECGENIRIKIENYKIILYGCKNKHKITNILLDEYQNFNIDFSKIICQKCQTKNRNNTHNNEFYRCCKCRINICPLCRASHDRQHNIINYDRKYYICEEHNEPFMEYCIDCNKNICLSCEFSHNKHKTDSYKNILPDLDIINNKIK